MTMIKINLVPEVSRKDKGGFLNGGVGEYPQEVVAGILVAVFGFLFVIHALLGGAALYKVVERNMLQERWNSLVADKKVVDEILGQIQAVQMKMTSLRPITSVNPVLWSRFMKDVSLSVPKGASLKQVSLEKGVLIIKGSAISRKKNEMVLAGQFVATLKQKKTFVDYFIDVDVDYSIQRQEAGLLSVANLNLKARLK